MRKNPGYVLVLALVVVSITFIITTTSLDLVGRDNNFDFFAYDQTKALDLAEAGVDYAIRQLNTNSNYPGENNLALGDGLINIVVSGSGSSRTVTASATSPTNGLRATKTIQAQASLDSNTVEFFYGVQIDAGGLTMSNTSQVIGNVYSNGNITGSNNPTITGDVVVAGGITDDPTVAWTTQSADQFFANTSSNRDIAQSFTATASDKLVKASVYLGKVGNPTSNITARIMADVSGHPSTTTLASTVIPSTNVGLNPSWIDFTFSNPPTLTNGSKYWIVLDYNTNSSVNYWNWRIDPTDGYVNNTGLTTASCCSGSPSWTNLNGDLDFRAWIGGTITGISGMTIGSSTGGTARANQFTNTSVHGSACPNSNCIIDNPAASTLPVSDGVIQDWKDTASAGTNIVGSINLTNGQTMTLGPAVVHGDLTLSNSSILTLTGTVWVTGNVSVSNSSTVKLDSGYGSNSGVIVNDGTIATSNNSQFLGAGNGSYILLLTTIDAKNQDSITVNNSSTGVIYYAGKSRISFTNSAAAKEATAWGMDLSNSASVTYDSGLANATFSNGPGGGWQIKAGTWQIL